jgi:eukaryotic-like serine/threonine-protein kinase
VDNDTPGLNAVGAVRLEGRVLADRYRVESFAASGANTIIVEGIDTESDIPVTIKVVRPERAIHESFRSAFRRQVAVAQSLVHPNIAKVLDSGELEIDGESTLFWVVEYLGGGSLRDLFDRGRLLEPSQALVVGLEACRALDVAHARGVVHTEITPSKLVFGDDSRLRVVDFAMAELMGIEAWEEPATVATHVARYASPEQALGMDVDAKTDVYALALCLIEAITGSVPFAGDSTVSTLAARVGKLMPVTADMGSLAAVLERAGRPEPEDRWTAAEFGAALIQAAGTMPRPEPIPIMATSLFASSIARRQSAAAESVADADLADADLADVPSVDVVTGEPQESEMTFAGPPTEAIEPTESAGTADGVESTMELPAAAAAAAAVATTPATTQMDVIDPTPSGVLYDAERDSRPWGKYIGIGVVIVIGLVALGVAGFMLLRTKSYEVPDLVGIDQAVAVNEVSGNDWVIETERERSDEVPEIDHVVRTVPAAGEMLDEGETFVIVVSDGPELRTIPELTGMPLTDVQALLTELRLVYVEGTSEFSETVPAGSVISWQVQDNASLVAGAQVLPETAIVVNVSLGPAPRPAPDLTNQTVDEATVTLTGLQLVIARGEDEFSNTIEAGRVVSQDPVPTTPVERGGTVTVRVSKGPDLVAIPDLTGLTYPQAQQALTDAGYVVNSLLGTTEGIFVSISVAGTETQAGATFPRGTGVDLIFL